MHFDLVRHSTTIANERHTAHAISLVKDTHKCSRKAENKPLDIASSRGEHMQEHYNAIAAGARTDGSNKLSSSHKGVTRRGTPKSRTGCLNCKKRKIKCDEQRPRCQKCIDFRFGSRDCVYLEAKPTHTQRELLPLSSKSAKTGKPIKPNLPTKRTMQEPRPPTTAITLPPTTQPPQSQSLSSVVQFPSTPRFHTPQEYHFYTLFHTTVINELSAFSHSPLWHTSILQSAHTHPVIRNITMAVAALYSITARTPYLRPSDAHLLCSADHAFAVRAYQSALERLRELISEGGMDVRTALMACLLTVCFENAYGRKDLALRNSLEGVKLQRKAAVSTITSNGSGNGNGNGNAGVEEELVAVFSRLEVSAMIFVDLLPKDSHRGAMNNLQGTIEKMPKEFRDLEQATVYGNAVMNRCWHFMNMVQDLQRPRWKQADEMEIPERCIWLDVRYGMNPWTAGDEPVPEQWLKEAATCAGEVEKWFAAFEPLWRDLDRDHESSASRRGDFLNATLLNLQVTSTYVSVRGSVYTRETEWDVHTVDFDRIATLAASYICTKPSRFYFAFEGETIIYLYYLMWKCRSPSIRRRVLVDLESHPRREASWDTVHTASLGRWVMETEEEGILLRSAPDSGGIGGGEGGIREKERLRLMGKEFDTANGTIKTWVYRMRGGERELLTHLWP